MFRWEHDVPAPKPSGVGEAQEHSSNEPENNHRDNVMSSKTDEDKQRQMERLETFVIEMTRELRQGQVDTNRRFSHLLERLESQLSSHELRLTRLHDATEGAQDAHQRVAVRLEQRLVVIEKELARAQHRAERNERTIDDVSNSVKISLNETLKSAQQLQSSAIERQQTLKAAEQRVVLQRLEDAEASVTQVRQLVAQRLDELDGRHEQRVNELNDALRQQVAQRETFESGFKRFMKRLQDEVRELVEKVQQNTRESHDYLREMLQTEVRKRVQGDVSTLRDSKQSLASLQGTVFDLSRQLKAQFMFTQESLGKQDASVRAALERLQSEAKAELDAARHSIQQQLEASIERCRSERCDDRDEIDRERLRTKEQLVTLREKLDAFVRQQLLHVEQRHSDPYHKSFEQRRQEFDMDDERDDDCADANEFAGEHNGGEDGAVFDVVNSFIEVEPLDPVKNMEENNSSEREPTNMDPSQASERHEAGAEGLPEEERREAAGPDVGSHCGDVAEPDLKEQQEEHIVNISAARDADATADDGDDGGIDVPDDVAAPDSVSSDAYDEDAFSEIADSEAELADVNASRSASPDASAHGFDVAAVVEDDVRNIADATPTVVVGDGIGGDLHWFTTESVAATPLPLGVGSQVVALLSAGASHALCCTTAGSVFAWGRNDQHQLGLGLDVAQETIETPTLVDIPGVVISVACGAEHSLAATSAGTAFSWGSALLGRLGQPRDVDLALPTAVDAVAGVRVVSAGAFNSGFLDNNGALWVCGSGESGQIGDGQTEPRLEPVQVRSDDAFVAVAFGDRHAVAITADGSVCSWGNGEFGELGYSVSEPQTLPRSVEGLPGRATKVSCGERHSTVLMEDASVWSFGSGETHQIGVFDNVDQFAPVRVKALDSADWKVSDISCGRAASLCVSNTGDVFGWGFAFETPVPKLLKHLRGVFALSAVVGERMFLRSGTKQRAFVADLCAGRESIQAVSSDSLAGARLVQMASGKHHMAAINAAGSVLVWGSDDSLLLGLGADRPNQHVTSPTVLSVSVKTPFSAVACGYEHTLALTEDGRVFSWGNALMGRLGHGPDVDAWEPTLVPALAAVVEIACGQFNSGAVLDDGSLYVWGAGRNGQIGVGTDEPQMLPAHVSFFNDEALRVRALALGDQHTVAITDKGKVYSWGDNEFGQLARVSDDDGDDDEQRHQTDDVPHDHAHNLPRLVVGLDHETIVQVCCSERSTLALSENGSVYSWGDGATAQLGVGDLEERRRPARLEALQGRVVLRIDAGPLHCAAVADDGSVFVWGFELSDEPFELHVDAEESCPIRTACCTNESLILASDV